MYEVALEQGFRRVSSVFTSQSLFHHCYKCTYHRALALTRRVGPVPLCSEYLPEDGTPVPKHESILHLFLNVIYQVHKLVDVLPLSDFKQIKIFSTDFSRRLQYQILRKSAQCEPRCYMRTDGQPDMTNLIAAFRDLCEPA
jgi:hypothetical protein